MYLELHSASPTHTHARTHTQWYLEKCLHIARILSLFGKLSWVTTYLFTMHMDAYCFIVS